ncbi:MAG: class II glutamine amidotransferase [Pseudomonadota bacterium]
MCELFAMSSSRPTALTYSLPEFSKNGSALRSNRDGFGIALARDKDAIVVKEPETADDNIWVRFIAEHAIDTQLAIAHVRYATRGAGSMQNTHPFRRALGGRTHLFAHNGTLKDIDNAVEDSALHYQPLGETDSERAFCWLLTRLRPLYVAGQVPTLDERFAVFSEFCADMKELGTCNFLYHDGEVLFAHAHRRIWEENGELTDAKPPGLSMKRCMLCAAQKELHTSGLDVAFESERTILLASVPLDADGWEPLDEGSVVAIQNGELVKLG